MVCPPVQEIIHSLKLADYLLVQVNKPWYNYYLKQVCISSLTVVELQWLEHCWLVYHGCFELMLESLGKNPMAADLR